MRPARTTSRTSWAGRLKPTGRRNRCGPTGEESGASPVSRSVGAAIGALEADILRLPTARAAGESSRRRGYAPPENPVCAGSDVISWCRRPNPDERRESCPAPASLDERPSYIGDPTDHVETPSTAARAAPGAARGSPGPRHLYLGGGHPCPQQPERGSVERSRELEGRRVARGGRRRDPDLPCE